MSELVFRPAEKQELETVVSLYEEAKGKEFCFWDEEYPTISNARSDYESGGLFVLCESGRIVGALSLEHEKELDALVEWEENNSAEIGRIIVKGDSHGKGYAGYMVTKMAEFCKKRSFAAIHLSAAKGNVPALKTYEKLGFKIKSCVFIYGGEYYLLEKIL